MSRLLKVCLLTIICALSLFFTDNASAQNRTFDGEEILPPTLNSGDFLITGFMSYPSWDLFVLDLVNGYTSNPNYDNVSLFGVAPFGLKVEYMFTSIFGLTLEGMYNFWDVSFDVDGYENSFGIRRTRIQVGMNYHVDDINVQDLDVYGGLAIGTNSRLVRSESTDPNFAVGNYYPGWNITSPISFRVRAGLSYFLSDNWAINFEVGFGGPVIAAGLMYRSLRDQRIEQPETESKL